MTTRDGVVMTERSRACCKKKTNGGAGGSERLSPRLKKNPSEARNH